MFFDVGLVVIETRLPSITVSGVLPRTVTPALVSDAVMRVVPAATAVTSPLKGAMS